MGYATQVVAPESCRHCYSERLAIMPNCYFVNDYKQAHMVRARGWSCVSQTARTEACPARLPAGYGVQASRQVCGQQQILHTV